MNSTLTIAERERILKLARAAHPGRSGSQPPPLEPADRGGRLALSFTQQRLWFLEQLNDPGGAYHLPGRLRLRGVLDGAALVRALDRIVARHEALRTTFVVVDGEPEQRIAPAGESSFRLTEHDLRDHPAAEAELDRLIAEEAGAPFDLERGPLVRGRLVRLAADDQMLLVTMHHIVSDGWSVGVFIDELSVLYGAFTRGDADPLPPLALQYADYAAWQRRWVEGEVLQEQADYWREALAGAPELLELPTDRVRPARQEHTGGLVRVVLGGELTAGLKALSQRHGTTLYMTLLAGWAALLGRLSGQEDVVVGTPTANRGRREVEGLIGFFVSTLAIRVELSGSPTVGELLRRVKVRALQAQQHQDIPFEQVVELVQPARSLAHNPVFQVMFAWQNAPRGTLELPGLELTPVEASARVTARFDLSLDLGESGGRIVGGVTYATSLFEAATVERYAGYLRRVLEGMAADEGRRVERLEVLAQSERRQVVEAWNRTEAAYPGELCVHELFQAQAGRTPEAVALVFEGGTLTYAELNRRANRLAHHLGDLGVGPDVRVGLCLERSPEMVVAVLAVLKAGGAYVPLDPEFPAPRLHSMLAESEPAVLLTQRSLAGLCGELRGGLGVPVLAVDAAASSWAGQAEGDPPRGGLTPENLAYVIYTSGSTGAPKGVMNAHRGVVNRLLWMQEAYGLGAAEAVLQKTPYSFDVSVWEFFWPLGVGARLVVARPGGHREPAYLAETIRREGITTVHFVPSMLPHFVEQEGVGRCTGLRRVVCSGEALPSGLVERVHERLPGVEVHNLYGPTEAAVDVTAWRCFPGEEGGSGRVPLGRPVSNTRIYVLDREGEPVPVGVAGELYIGGVQVSRGYQKRADLTAERFVPDAFGGEAGARLYRTGDVGRWVGEGRLEYLGRNDFQVKVRGFRIELGEIEARLGEHAGVREAVVVGRADAPGEVRLVAYYVGGEAVAVEALRSHLGERLPEHMVPAAYVRLERLPLTANGKLDRRGLPAPEGDAYARRGYEAPEGEVEQTLAQVWAEVLGVERVGRHDHFFELGGHSLLAVRLIERMRQRELHADVQALFTTPTLAQLAAAVGAETLEVEPPPNGIPTPCEVITPEMLPLVELTQPEIDRITARVEGGARNVQDIYPLAPLQEGILFHHLAAAEGDPYLMSAVYGFDGRERLDAYLAAMRTVIGRHDILRTSVMWEGLPEPVQVVWREARLEVEEVVLDPAVPDPAGRLWAHFDPRRNRLDVRRAPLMKIHVARDGDGDRWLLLLSLHHLVDDSTTVEALQREIETQLLGLADELPAPLPFRNYVAQARLGVSRAEHEAFFRELLGDVEEPTAPFGLLDVRGDGSKTGEARLPVEEELAARLRARARKLGVSAASVCHVAWAQVLALVSGRDDVVFGTVLFGRMHGGMGADRVLGPFINTLPVRVHVGSEGAEASVRGTHLQLAELLRHEHASLALAQRCSRVEAPAPLFTALLNYRHNMGAAKARTAEASRAREGMGGIRREERTNYPVTLTVDDLGEGFTLKAFAPASVGPERVCAMVHRALAGLVEALERAPERPVGRLDVLPEGERRRVVEEWNATEAEFPRGACLHELFEAQVERTPDAVALVFEGEALSYADLNARANRLAHHLRALGVGPEVRVGLCVERSLELMIGLLGVLKAGGAYVALDPEYPPERLRYMLVDSEPAVLLTRGAPAGRFGGLPVPVVSLDGDAGAWADRPASNPPRAGLTPAHLAYVIYTSGSTGHPKGVLVEHRSIVNALWWMQAAWPLRGDDVVLQKTPYSFDASLRELVPPLLAGARLVVARPGGHRDPSYLLETIRREGVTTLHFVPTMLRVLVQEGDLGRCTTLRRVVCGGEALPRELARRFQAQVPGARLYNVYGPTEAAVDVTAWSCAGEAGAGEGTIPIGRPMANTRLYVLDRGGEPVPAGVVGELYIGGVQVARGYRNRAEHTAERFVPDGFGGEGGGRLYRTGDLGRWVGEGAIEFVGRGDAQVKVRGFRIELGEIESRLGEHRGIREAVVVAREEAGGERRLVAYCVGGEVPEAEVLRAFLSERLPEHMVPAAYVRLEALPRTPSGKVDRRALPAPEGDAYARSGYEAPVGEAEQALAEIWSDVLGVERVGRWDHFFELGGHSLLAVQVISRVRQVLGVEVALGEVFERPVLAEQARGLEASVRAELPPIEPVERGGPLALSFAQQRLWFLEQLGGMGSAYHVPKRLRLRGELEVAALRRALDRIVARHEVLRTTFVVREGEPEQRIAPAGESGLQLVEHDLVGHAEAEGELRRLVGEEAVAPFDLERGPLVRGRLIRVGEEEHVLLVTLHHIVSDAWSTGVLIHELGVLYRAYRRGEGDPLPPLAVQYADYAAWQRRRVEGEVLLAQAAYWERTLAGAPELLELPTDHVRPARQDHAGGLVRVELSGELTAGLKALSRREGTTLFMTLLAGWAAVLGRLSGQEEVVVGTPTANRGRREIEGLIGFFVNTLAIRVELWGSPTVAELLGRVRARALEAQQNQDIPFEQVVERVQPVRSLAHSSVYQVMLAWQNTPRERLELPGLELAPVAEDFSDTAKFDLSLSLWEARGRIAGGLTFATSLFELATVARYAGYLRRVLEGMAAEAGRPVESLDLLPEAERVQVLEDWNRTEAEYPRHQCVHGLFEAQAARTPEAVAVVYEGRTLTYAELNARANRLAHHLVRRGVRPDVRVGLCLERSLDMVVGLLGVLKAGGAYVALDPEYPDDRRRYMLADSGPAVLLTQASLVERFAGMDVPVVAIDADASSWAEMPETSPDPQGLTPEHLVYVIYTSGSTGQPKGVMNVHRNVVNRIAAIQASWRLESNESVLQNASLSFDVSAYEFFWPLMMGARVVMTRPEGHKDPDYLVDTIRSNGVGTASFVPSMLQIFLEHPELESCTELVRVPCGGEALPASLVQRFHERLPNARLYNRYGPSEAATAVTGESRAAEERKASVPIGRPMANTRIYVLDRAGEPVPVGVAGELYIGGAGVGRGYLGRTEQTAERFVPDPFGGGSGERLYRTGDLARWLADGRVDFLGRNDFQVKVRGFRVEPGEIEARLAEHPAVREAVVLAREDSPGDKRLVAYYVGAGGAVEVEKLRAHLGERLPEYMVPAAYVWLDAMPLTPNGKLDRGALPAPEGDAYTRRGYEAPEGETEMALAAVWSELLGVERVGRNDHFFELGGHSLLASRLALRIRQEMEVEIALRDIFEKPVLSTLALQVLDAQLAQFDAGEMSRLAQLLG